VLLSSARRALASAIALPDRFAKQLSLAQAVLTLIVFPAKGGTMAGFLGQKEVFSIERVREILRKKEYSYIEEKAQLLEVREDSLVLKISFLIEYRTRMICIDEKEPIVIPLKDFKFEDWGDGVRKIADIE
jgi:hypothetical protein